MKVLLLLVAIYLLWKFAANIIKFIFKFALIGAVALLVLHYLIK